MCSPCYNNSFYVAYPDSPWCGTAEPVQVNSCLTECSSYGLVPQARPRFTPDLVYFPGFFLFIHIYSIWHTIKGKISPPFILLKTTKVARKKAKFFYSLSLACLPLVLQLSFTVPKCVCVYVCLTPFLTIPICLHSWLHSMCHMSPVCVNYSALCRFLSYI